jgi:hypothetical protein
MIEARRKVVADTIHKQLCHYNHTDYCSYEYENWEKPGGAKKEWLKKADALLARYNADTILGIMNILKA